MLDDGSPVAELCEDAFARALEACLSAASPPGPDTAPGAGFEHFVREHRPLLVASRAFRPIGRVLVAFDGSATAREAWARPSAMRPSSQAMRARRQACEASASGRPRCSASAIASVAAASARTSADRASSAINDWARSWRSITPYANKSAS